MVIDSSDDEDLDCAKETAPEIRDIDSSNDIFSCSEYASEIFQNLKQSEVHVFIFSCILLLRLKSRVMPFCELVLIVQQHAMISTKNRMHVIE